MHPLTDPQLIEGLAGFEQVVPGGITLDDIPATRQFLDGLTVAMAAQAPDISGVVTSDHYAPGSEDAPDVMVRMYQPETRPDTLPALLWIHGGGYVLGNVQGDDLKAKGLALALNCVVASVRVSLGTRNIPFLPHWKIVMQLSNGWRPMLINSVSIRRVLPSVGASAGGGLAAGLGLLARDRAEVDICYQLLIYPMIDDTNIEQAGPDVPDAPLWTRANNLEGWRSYLGARARW